jgi:protein-export membrane protein SecD
MAVDANVLINERIREEFAMGKTLRAAIDAGYSRAMPSIIDSNVTTLITCIILYQFGTGPVQGFALTLMIGLVCSMFTSIIMTHIMFDLTLGSKPEIVKFG